jgi:hypothetical protein
MNQCLSDQVLLQCYTGEGAASELAHLKSCLTCAGRYKALESDLALITQVLDAPPPRRRPATAGGFAQWRVAFSAAAVLVAFVVGWSLRGTAVSPPASPVAPVALHQPARSSAPIQVSALDTGDDGAMYAAYVQGAFNADPCSDANDPLEPGCL